MAPVSKAKTRKATSVQIEYLVHIQEIKPWPPSQSLRSLHFIVLQWEYGEWYSGSTNPVVPSLGSGVRDGKIEFNEYFKLPITLSRNISLKGDDVFTFQKNRLEFSLYEPRRDNTVRGQLLGTAVIDLAEYGVLKETCTMNVSMNCNRTFRNTSQPVLFVKVQPLVNHGSNYSRRENLSKETPLVKDDSSHSTIPSSVPRAVREVRPITEQDKPDVESSKSSVSKESDLLLEPEGRLIAAKLRMSSSIASHSSKQNRENGHASLGKPSEGSLTSTPTEFKLYEGKDQHVLPNYNVKGIDMVDLAQVTHEVNANGVKKEDNAQQHVKECVIDGLASKPTCSVMDLKLGGKSGPVAAITRGGENEACDIPFVKDIKEIKDDCHKEKRKTKQKDAVTVRGVPSNNSFESRIQQLGNKIEKLEEELIEVAAIEFALYSVVAEHGNSSKNFFAPARRLSRFYLQTCKEEGPSYKTASVARAALSGLVVVAKACGKDVSRLTFWLSNSVALRVIVSQDIENRQPTVFDPSDIQTNDGGKVNAKRSFQVKNDKSYPSKKENNFDFTDKLNELENPGNFITAVEKIEAWIFSRIVESAWQESVQKRGSSVNKMLEKNQNKGDQGQASFPLELWKKAFKGVYDRLCPVRAGGHECACFSLMNRLIMEQFVNQLDVAMLNALLGNSADKASTAPLLNPMVDAKVLPVAAGIYSFRNGVQLKNAILNWSQWLSSLVVINNNDSQTYENVHDNGEHKESFKSFRLLNALSDLMMLPKDMLMDRSIRKEHSAHLSLREFLRALFRTNSPPNLFQRACLMYWIPRVLSRTTAAACSSKASLVMTCI
ncbi:hypothetical protein Scep_021026 [Stephania cephalantha]|uniref:C2 NT-type domain-containing protein n=1 Tax=Stephania cephalantha TaxID=152367 RepID=A0AAP0F5B4_9MAGN